MALYWLKYNLLWYWVKCIMVSYLLVFNYTYTGDLLATLAYNRLICILTWRLVEQYIYWIGFG
jgi:hypothetical protein